MTRFIVRRLFSIAVTLWVVATLAFGLIRLVPGGPFDREKAIPIEVARQLSARYRLDAPLVKQYLVWVWNLVAHHDLGPTFKYPNRSVNEIIALSFPISAQLGICALVFALALGLPLGIAAAASPKGAIDRVVTALSVISISVPRFVVAPLLVWLFALHLYWLPVGRWETWRHMVMPAFCTGLPVASYIARLSRAGMHEVLATDFIRTAHAKGLSKSAIVLRHALRGALLPVVSFLGPGISGLLVGSVVVEKIFNIPGMGRYFVEAAINRDYNLLLGVMLVYGSLLMVLNAMVDIAYAFLDPRVRLAST